MRDFFASAEVLKDALPSGKSLTLVGGCFDLFHVGHLHVLRHASELEELLVVGVLSDSFIRSYKGMNRPVIPEAQRAAIVANIGFVDYVFIANESPNHAKTLELLRPQTVVFGEEPGTEEKVNLRTERIRLILPQTRVVLLPRYEKETVSTSSIIKLISGEETEQCERIPA